MAFKCSIRHKIASKCMQVFESIIAKMLLIISICSIIYSNNWLSVFINFAFLFLAIFSMITYAKCYQKTQPVLALPLLINQTVFIFWIFIWLYASIVSITSGNLWSLEWLGGPKSSREVGSRDVTDPKYIDPNETHPETKKSITYGSIIMGVSLVVMIFKIIGWRIAKTTYDELKIKRSHLNLLESKRLENANNSTPTDNGQFGRYIGEGVVPNNENENNDINKSHEGVHPSGNSSRVRIMDRKDEAPPAYKDRDAIDERSHFLSNNRKERLSPSSSYLESAI